MPEQMRTWKENRVLNPDCESLILGSPNTVRAKGRGKKNRKHTVVTYTWEGRKERGDITTSELQTTEQT